MKMRLFIVIICYFLLSCGPKSSEDLSEEKDYLSGDDLNQFDLPNVTHEKLNQLEQLTIEFYKNPHDIRKFKQIEKIVKSFGVKKKIIDLLDSKEKENGKTAITFLISKYWFRLNYIQKSLKYYDENVFDWGLGVEEVKESIIENIVLKELLSYSQGERKNHTEMTDFFKSDIIYGFRKNHIDIINFLSLYYPEAVYSETNDSIFIELYNIKKNFLVQNSILVCDKNIFINGENLFFDLLSGIKTKNGGTIHLRVNYLQNGMFFTTDLGKHQKARDGSNGIRAKISSRGTLTKAATKGENGFNGNRGASGGDITIDSKEMPNSWCSIELCRTIIITNGSKGENGGNGGRGGDGIKYKEVIYDFYEGDKINNRLGFHEVTKTIKPEKGGEKGIGGSGGFPGKLTLKGAPFVVNTLVKYSLVGPDGEDGKKGVDGKMR